MESAVHKWCNKAPQEVSERSAGKIAQGDKTSAQSHITTKKVMYSQQLPRQLLLEQKWHSRGRWVARCARLRLSLLTCVHVLLRVAVQHPIMHHSGRITFLVACIPVSTAILINFRIINPPPSSCHAVHDAQFILVILAVLLGTSLEWVSSPPARCNGI